MTTEQIYSQIAKLIVEDGWSPILVMRAGAIFAHSDVYAPEVYYDPDESPSTWAEGDDWTIVHEFHSSESITEARHVRYWLEGYVKDAVEDDIPFNVVCAEIMASGGDADDLVGWALLVRQ